MMGDEAQKRKKRKKKRKEKKKEAESRDENGWSWPSSLPPSLGFATGCHGWIIYDRHEDDTRFGSPCSNRGIYTTSDRYPTYIQETDRPQIFWELAGVWDLKACGRVCLL